MPQYKILYESLRKQYNLPEFNSLAEDFDIEKIGEKETSFLLRELRRTINEKISAYLHLFEVFINPANPPVFVFTMLKNTKEDERKTIKEVYKELAKLEVEMMKLDTIYNEKKEAEFIKTANKTWNSLKKKIEKLLESFDRELEESNNSVQKGYFG